MKRLIVSMNITLDGCISGPDCELDWHLDFWRPDMGDAMATELSKADSILLGRVTYKKMEKFFLDDTTKSLCSRDENVFAEMMNQYAKYVYSNTLDKVPWINSIQIRGGLRSEILKLKNNEGKNIIVYGSGTLAKSLLKHNLVDELQLWIHPVILGNGKLLFDKSMPNSELVTVNTINFKSGVIFVHYEVTSK